MNSCILMAEIIQQPQLRYTPDNQLQIAEMLVQFPGPKPEDPPEHLKVIGWGNFAQEIHQKYREGDRVIIEGRLGMNTIERDGIKEKRAELTAQRIYSVGAEAASAAPATRNAPEQAQIRDSAPANVPSNVVPLGSRNRSSSSPPAGANRPSNSDWNSQPLNYDSDRSSSSSNEPENPDYDPIPF
ncbi:single-stranded DNA-binding protein [Tychonema sp. LEGE 07203]|uniref:single-stranded DNA-binding protein n=1 Tax=Tychonema sp. LEGE 07203 TaxID=1828671 RepID=UPI00187FA9E5|nr:single-stranded DNA-binding protein [Tychonema sp. LEGE 07203]MBE9094731.1 single-stranded DNA-binding protein [Tychonema sp. LEGE 07203]